jgi:S-adenosylmethionine decarboxylase
MAAATAGFSGGHSRGIWANICWLDLYDSVASELADPARGTDTSHAAADAAGAHVLAGHFHHRAGQVTGVLLLAESHQHPHLA